MQLHHNEVKYEKYVLTLLRKKRKNYLLNQFE